VDLEDYIEVDYEMAVTNNSFVKIVFRKGDIE
jgi:hypothetical protein